MKLSSIKKLAVALTAACAFTFNCTMFADEPAKTPTTMPATMQATADGVIQITGAIDHPQSIERAALAAMPHQTVKTKDHNGQEATYSGVRLRDVLALAGAPIAANRMRGPNLQLFVVATGAHGYRAVIALAELDAEFAERDILIADARNGEPLDAKDGPVRLVLPQEARQSRWVRKLIKLEVQRAS